MPRAIPLPTRQDIVQRHQEGASLRRIAEELSLPFSTVRQIWRRFRDHGEAGLPANYAACRRPGPRSARRVHRAALWLRRRHPDWGGGLIRLLIAQRWPDEPVPHERTLQRWFCRAHLNHPHSRLPPPNRERAQQPHEVWQIDAKEQIRLADGSQVSWLSVVDEASGAHLATEVFPPGLLGEGAGG
jgi:transposase